MSNTSTISLEFPTSLTTGVSVDVAANTASVLTALDVDLNLLVGFATRSITSYTYNGGTYAPPAGNTELVVNTDNFFETSATTSVVLVQSDVANAFFNGGEAANQTVVAGTGSLTYIANDGNGTVLAAGGDNFLSTVDVGPNTESHTFLVGGDGFNFFELYSGDNTVSDGSGQNNYLVGTGDNVIHANGLDNISVLQNTTAANDTVSAVGNTNAISIDGSNNNITFLNGSGSSTLTGDTGSDTVNGGIGGGFFQGGTAGNNVLIAGTGQVTLVGGGNGDLLELTKGNAADFVQAGAGNETLLGGQSKGADVFQAGTGNDSISAGLGSDTFLFANGQAGGKDTISGFGSNHGNTIELQGYASNEVSSALASATTSHGSTTFTLSDNTTVTLVGVTHLTASNFS